MIGKLKYEDVLAISKDLRVQAEVIAKLLKDKNVQELSDFVATVEGYSKYLENVVEINIDADKALKDLIN